MILNKKQYRDLHQNDLGNDMMNEKQTSISQYYYLHFDIRKDYVPNIDNYSSVCQKLGNKK